MGMSNSTSIDVNYMSVSNTGQWVQDAGSPNPINVPVPTNWDWSNIDGSKYASLLKLSGYYTGLLTGLVIPQGKECAVDINNHANVTVKGFFGSNTAKPAGDQIFSVKGGSSAVIYGILLGAGGRMNADILVDNWSDQSYNGSTADLSSLVHISGRKINVVKRYFASKVTLGDHAQVLVLMSVGLTVYWWFKWLVRLIMGIKVGQRGPSWL
jgi:hypothetical protein